MERRLAAILAADVVGYSKLVQADEATTLRRMYKRLGKGISGAIGSPRQWFISNVGEVLMQNALKVLALMALLSACATQPVDTSQARAVPPSSILSAQLLSPEPGTGKLIVKRDSGLMGVACSIRIYVDGEPVVDLNTSEKFEFYLPVGDHVLGAQPNGICGGGSSGVEVVIAENRTKVYRVSSGQSGDVRIQPSAF